MRRPLQVSLVGVSLCIVVVAVGCAALVSTSRIWVHGLFTVVIVALLLGVLAAVHELHEFRAFWLGFCLFGATYFALSIGPGSQLTEPYLATAALLDVGYQLVPKREVRTTTVHVPKGTPGIRRDGPNGAYLGTFVAFPFETHFRLVGHLLTTLIAGMVGAAVSVWFHRRNSHPS